MLDLRNAKQITVIGGGAAGWFAALVIRKIFHPGVAVKVIASEKIGIVGVGEGGLLNIVQTLNHLQIPTGEFIKETKANYKLGFRYKGWRTGLENDEYFHFFMNHRLVEMSEKYADIYPVMAAYIALGKELHKIIPIYQDIIKPIGFDEMTKHLLQTENQGGIGVSFHFDSFAVAEFLKKIAIQRHVVYEDAEVQDFEQDEQGNVCKIITDKGITQTDFIIDASGFKRILIGKYLKSDFESFEKYLILDKAIPYHLQHPKENPELITTATAFEAGWEWQIPLKDRIGAGYVFSSAHKTEQQAMDELEQRHDNKIELFKTLSFVPGIYKKVWIKNVVSVGLASGFVEPLEATSLGQTFEQLRSLGQVISQSGWLITDKNIEKYNEGNLLAWHGIRDFLRMHYDCTRKDNAFWQDISNLPYPDEYHELKQIMQQRTLREIDINHYIGKGWQGIFHVHNWSLVADGLGLISKQAAVNDLNLLPKEVAIKAFEQVQMKMT
nr:tryptophan 7-halogenase [Acinetobacter sp. Marseille-Q1620]